jgi:hypothetical protein
MMAATFAAASRSTKEASSSNGLYAGMSIATLIIALVSGGT